jgi:hypothetical protein
MQTVSICVCARTIFTEPVHVSGRMEDMVDKQLTLDPGSIERRYNRMTNSGML